MRQDKKLILGMALLFFITFVALGTIVVTEKLAPYYTDKIKIKMNEYLKEKYPEEVDNFKLGKITYKTQVYTAKVANKNNKNLYFTISYQNKKIKDTYRKDYLKGNTLLTTIEEELEKKIKNNLNIKSTIIFPLTLDKYTTKIKEDIINNNINELNIYNISFSINSDLTQDNIYNLTIELTNKIKEINTLNIYPNHYTITINSKKENKSLTIKNLTNKTLDQQNLTQIISYIMIEDEKTSENNIIKENNISYEYKRYGDE